MAVLVIVRDEELDVQHPSRVKLVLGIPVVGELLKPGEVDEVLCPISAQLDPEEVRIAGSQAPPYSAVVVASVAMRTRMYVFMGLVPQNRSPR